MRKLFVKDEKGFTMLEIILSVFLVSVALLSLFMMINEINRIDMLSKENHYAEKLINPYISYYQNIEVTEDNLNVLLSDVEKVNLVKESGDVPPAFRSLDVECINNPSLVDGRKFIQFEITCEVDESPVNKGKPFTLKKYIN